MLCAQAVDFGQKEVRDIVLATPSCRILGEICSTLKPWLVRLKKESITFLPPLVRVVRLKPFVVRSTRVSDCEAIDCGSLLKRVVTRGDDNAASIEQFVVGLGFHSSAEASVWSILMFKSARKLLDEQTATVDLCLCPNAVHDVSHDSLFTALELRARESWSVRKCRSRFTLHCDGVERIEPAIGQACESVSCDSLFTALELRALETWSVRPDRQCQIAK